MFIEAEITQLAEVDRVSKQITTEQPRIDYLCMIPGYLPVAGPQRKLTVVIQLACPRNTRSTKAALLT